MAIVAILVVFSPLVVGFERYLGAMRAAILYPHGLDYGEGVVWAQLREMVAGRGYGAIDEVPSLVFHYPPLYHLVTAALAHAISLDQLAAGRVVSVGATLAMASIIGLVASHLAGKDGDRGVQCICGLVAGLLVFSMMPVLHWSRLMRVDMLALFFGFAGLYCGLRSVAQPRMIHVAAVFFVTAMFTKQTSFAPALAVLGMLLFLRPSTALKGLATATIVSTAALVIALTHFGAGFLKHLVQYNMNSVEWARLRWIMPMLMQHALFIAAAIYTMAKRLHRLPALHGWGTAECQTVIIASHWLIATIMLLTIVKSGSAYNYFLEWLGIVAILAGLGMQEVVLVATGKDGPTSLVLAVMVPMTLGLQSFLLPDTPRDAWRADAAHRMEQDRLVAMVATTSRPVIATDLALLLRAGKTPQWEPFTFPELATKGLWSDRDLNTRIRRKDFAFFVTANDDANAVSLEYSPSTAAAIRQAYPVTIRTAGATISLPLQAHSTGAMH